MGYVFTERWKHGERRQYNSENATRDEASTGEIDSRNSNRRVFQLIATQVKECVWGSVRCASGDLGKDVSVKRDNFCK